MAYFSPIPLVYRIHPFHLPQSVGNSIAVACRDTRFLTCRENGSPNMYDSLATLTKGVIQYFEDSTH
jgi:hypothetical protein